MFSWLNSHGFANDSLEGQMKYMAHEAMTGAKYGPTRAALMHATPGSIDRDTRIITPNFEGPKFDNSGARVGFVRSALGRQEIANPLAHLDPNFNQKLKVFKDAKPLGSDKHSMNEHHDHRMVNSNVVVNVKGAFPVDKTERPLERPKLATFIRNNTSFAS